MQQDTTIQMIGPGPSASVTLLFYIGTRNLYSSWKAMTQVKHLKQNPTLRAHLPSLVLSSESSESRNADNDGRRDTSDGH